MTAVELLPASEAHPGNPRWHQLRRQGVTASEIAAVLGISPWESPFSLYWRKANGWDADLSDEMVTGTICEPAIADLWGHHYDPHENLVLRRAGLYAHPGRRWQIATPDRLIYRDLCVCGAVEEPDVVCSCMPHEGQLLAVLECKWAGSWDGWGEPDTDQIPVYYRAQALWQCDVLDVDEWRLGVLGPSGFRGYHGYRDRAADRDLALMCREARRMLDRIESGDPPDIDGHTATIGALKKLHPTVEPGEVETSPEFADGWRRARAARKRAEDLCDRFEARARRDLGHYHRLVVGNQLVCSRSVFDQSSDQAELTALETDHPTTDRINPGKAIR